MATITLNGVPVTRGRLPLSLQGAWRAELELAADSTEGLSGPAELVIGSTTLRGTSAAAVDAGGRVTAVVLAGSQGLDTELPPKGYVGTTRRAVLDDALTAAGERLSATADAPALLLPISGWTRVVGPAGELVRAIARHGQMTWRYLLDGSIWMGEETWPLAAPEHVLESEEPAASRFVAALDGAVILPGTTVRGRRVSSVVYTFDATAIRAVVSYGVDRHPTAAMIATQVRRETAHLDYAGVVLCKVVRQNDDDTLELRSNDPRMPHLSRVRIRAGIAGVLSQRVKNGALVLLQHENSDPARPVVTGFAMGDADEVQIGGDAELVKLGPLQAWMAQLQTQNTAIGLTVPALVSAGTSVLKGG